MRILIILVTLALAEGAAASEPEFPLQTGRVLVITRHAEKLPGNDAPCLTRAGVARAARLATLLANMPIKALLSTDYCRTQETLAPLAAATGLEVDLYNPQDVEAIREHVLSEGNGAVVVSGHSNTVPALLARLGITVPEIGESDYGNLYLVSFNKEGTVSGVVRLAY